MTRYMCHFMFRDRLCMTASDRLSDFTEGFWINGDWLFTKASDCKYWIPPGRIELVSKIEIPD